MCRLICNLPEYNIRSCAPLKIPQFQMLILLVVKVVIGVKAKCKRSAVDFFNILRSIIINKTNVPADLQSAGIEYKDLFNPITSYFL